jgi:integrase
VSREPVSLTPAYVKGLAVEARINIKDCHPEAPRGFYLRVSPTSKAYYLLASVGGKKTWVKVGNAHAITLDAARKAAKVKGGLLAQGRDLNAEARLERARKAMERHVSGEWTVPDMVRAYLEARPKMSPTSLRTRRGILRREIETRMNMPARNVVKEDVRRALRPLANRAMAQAWCTLHLLRSAFRWAMDEEVVTVVDGIPTRRPRVERDPTRKIEEELGIPGRKPRQRVLSDTEIKAFWPALDKLPLTRSACAKILLLCGTRITETCLARWEHVDLGDNLGDGLWHIPAKNRKGRAEGMPGERRHLDVPLSPLAVEVLRELHTLTGKRERVFVAQSFNRMNLGREIREATGIKDVTPHDLRRTGSTGLQRIGAPPHVISVVLGHAREEGATATDVAYTHDRRQTEHRLWLAKWAAHVGGLLS